MSARGVWFVFVVPPFIIINALSKAGNSLFLQLIESSDPHHSLLLQCYCIQPKPFNMHERRFSLKRASSTHQLYHENKNGIEPLNKEMPHVSTTMLHGIVVDRSWVSLFIDSVSMLHSGYACDRVMNTRRSIFWLAHKKHLFYCFGQFDVLQAGPLQ